MPNEGICFRCGRPLVAGRCPACGTMSVGLSSPQRTPSTRWMVHAGRAGFALLVILSAFLHYLLRQHNPFLHSPVQPPMPARQYEPHLGPVAQLSELHGHGTIYLVQLTPHKEPYSAEDLAVWLRARYSLDARVLPSQPLPDSAWNRPRQQYVAELLYAQIKRDFPALASDPHAYLIGLTDANMYSVLNSWGGSFSQRDGERAAIVSSAGMDDRQQRSTQTVPPAKAAADLQARLRRIVLKDVAVLYWNLPVNNDPSSILHQPQDPDLPTEDIYESDLNPALTHWGQSEGEPCLFFRYSAAGGLQVLPGPLIRTCSEIPTPQRDSSTELFEVDLRTGLMIDRRTDLVIPGELPIVFERALRPGWKGGNPFGANGADSYDAFLASSDHELYIDVADDANSRWNLIRYRPLFSWFAPPTYVDSDEAGRYYTLRWRTTPYEHYDLRRYDGLVEAFLPCYSSTQFCYLNGIKDADGHQLNFTRAPDRRLLQVASSDGRWLRLSWGALSQIVRADDSLGQSVLYGYNNINQLTSVTYPGGENLHFEYDDANQLLTFSASPDAKTPPKVLLRSEYANGLLVRQTLSDGSVYLYNYGPMFNHETRVATVQTPDGALYTVGIHDGLSTTWEQPAPSPTAAAQSRSAAPQR